MHASPIVGVLLVQIMPSSINEIIQGDQRDEIESCIEANEATSPLTTIGMATVTS